MPRNTMRNSLLVALAAGMLPLLSGCGGSSGTTGAGSAPGAAGASNAGGAAQLAVPDGTDDATKKWYVEENAVAACMAKQGFTYTPKAPAASPTGNDTGSADAESYAAAKKYRQKYGFGTYAAYVYPELVPKAGTKGGPAAAPTPDKDQAGLSTAQRQAYGVALYGSGTKVNGVEKPGGCSAVGQTEAYGAPLSGAAAKKAEDASDQKNAENGQMLNGDPQLVQLAQDYAACLTAQGIQVTTTQPTGMLAMVSNDGPHLPEHHSMSRQAALPLLANDITLALKDLECGRKFRAAYFPKEKANPYFEVDG